MSKTILQALVELDVSNDDHWTDDGLPSLDVMRELTGNRKLRRSEVTEANPSFSRNKQEETPAEVVVAEEDPLDVVNKKLEQVDSQIESLRQQKDKLLKEQTRIITEGESKRPKLTHADIVRQYVENENKIREQAAARNARVQEMLRSV